jgi:hypothetical protein
MRAHRRCSTNSPCSRILAMSCLANQPRRSTAKDRVGQPAGSKLADSPVREPRGCAVEGSCIFSLLPTAHFASAGPLAARLLLLLHRSARAASAQLALRRPGARASTSPHFSQDVDETRRRAQAGTRVCYLRRCQGCTDGGHHRSVQGGRLYRRPGREDLRQSC